LYNPFVKSNDPQHVTATICCTYKRPWWPYIQFMKKLFILLSFVFQAQYVFSATSLLPLKGQDLFSSKSIEIDLKQKKGVVVVFLSAKCPCSNSHITEIKNLASEYPDVSFVAIHSNADESVEFSKPYFEKMALPFPVIQDHNTEIADRLQAFKTPHAFILSNQGDIIYQGGVSNSKDCSKADKLFLREALVDLQSGQKIRTPEGRTLGCSIARGEKNEKSN